MGEMRTLLYLFRGKVEVEEVLRFGATQRARVLQNCTASVVYLLNEKGEVKTNSGGFWSTATSVPDEIKLAALIVN